MNRARNRKAQPALRPYLQSLHLQLLKRSFCLDRDLDGLGNQRGDARGEIENPILDELRSVEMKVLQIAQ